MTRLKGKAVSPGIATGRALRYDAPRQAVLIERIAAGDLERERWRLDNGIKKTLAQLLKISRDLRRKTGQDVALIIESQVMLLRDSLLVEEIKGLIGREKVNAEWAIKEVERKYIDIFTSIPDLSFKAKSNDISDIFARLLGNLQRSRGRGRDRAAERELADAILVADDLTPSEAARLLSGGRPQGLILMRGGTTSHTTILARALEIPTLVEIGEAGAAIAANDLLILDAVASEVIVEPSPEELAESTVKKEKFRRYQERLQAISRLPDRTRDDHPFTLQANIELPQESDIVLAHGAKGIGLFRSEFLFLDPHAGLSEDEQFLIYKNIAQKIYPHPVVIRTFDVGRDKIETATPAVPEPNPSLGLMSTRLMLQQPDILKLQMKALLRANASGNIRILLPMITEVEELQAAKEILRQAREELDRRGQHPPKVMKVGIMVEIPAAISLIPRLGAEVDFFSVGTNDLIQYLLAVDRNNSAVAYLYNPFHPAVVQALVEIQRHCQAIGREVSVCGEMAGQPLPALMLLGMGYRIFSMNPFSLSEIKRLFTATDFDYLKRLIPRLAKLASRSEVEQTLSEALLRRYPDLLLTQQLL